MCFGEIWVGMRLDIDGWDFLYARLSSKVIRQEERGSGDGSVILSR